MNAVDLLESRHREVEKLLSRLDTTTMKRHREMLMAAFADERMSLKGLEEHLAGIKRLFADLVVGRGAMPN